MVLLLIDQVRLMELSNDSIRKIHKALSGFHFTIDNKQHMFTTTITIFNPNDNPMALMDVYRMLSDICVKIQEKSEVIE